MNAIVNQVVLESSLSARARFGLEAIGIAISRYGLVLVLLLIGLLKFTAAEAAGIQPLIAHSPLMSWMYAVLGVRGVSALIGTIEITFALLVALRPLSAGTSFVDTLGCIVTFLLTTSFLLSTPGAVRWSYGLPVLGDAGHFLIKDVVLLGASFLTASETLGNRRS
jgi:uncharacterized membrane protein YkgB